MAKKSQSSFVSASGVTPATGILSDMFRDYPEHQARIAAVEKKYFESRMRQTLKRRATVIDTVFS